MIFGRERIISLRRLIVSTMNRHIVRITFHYSLLCLLDVMIRLLELGLHDTHFRDDSLDFDQVIEKCGFQPSRSDEVASMMIPNKVDLRLGNLPWEFRLFLHLLAVSIGRNLRGKLVQLGLEDLNYFRWVFLDILGKFGVILPQSV